MYCQNISVNPIISKILIFVTSHFGTIWRLLFTAVSTKVVLQKHKSVRDNADWHYGKKEF